MAEPNWLNSSEMVIGASHPLYANTKDRCGQTIQNMLEVEHTTDGIHDIRLTGLVGEIDTFSGNGTARTISLTNTDLIPKKAYVWEARQTGERVTNGGFETDTTGWSFTGDGSATGGTPGGQSGDCVAIANNGTAPDYIEQTITGLVIGRSYTFSVYAKDGTIASASAWYQLNGAVSYGPVNFSTTAVWSKKTWTFTAAATSLTIALANNENILNGTILWDTCSLVENQGSDVTRIDLMANDKAQPFRYQSTAWQIDLLDNEQAGSFDIGDSYVNTNSKTNYYLVLGYNADTAVTGDTGAGSDPPWIESSTLNLIIADDTDTQDSGNIANWIEAYIWEMFTEEHNADGTHSITVAPVRLDTVLWAGNSADDRVISCNINDLDILYIEVYQNGSVLVSASSDMGADETKKENTAAFVANYIQDITTNGEIEVGTDLNASGQTYIAFIVGV